MWKSRKMADKLLRVNQEGWTGRIVKGMKKGGYDVLKVKCENLNFIFKI